MDIGPMSTSIQTTPLSLQCVTSHTKNDHTLWWETKISKTQRLITDVPQRKISVKRRNINVNWQNRIVYVKRTKMEPGGYEEVCHMQILPMNFWTFNYSLDFTSSLPWTPVQSAFSSLKGVHSFHQPVSLICIIDLTNPW